MSFLSPIWAIDLEFKPLTEGMSLYTGSLRPVMTSLSRYYEAAFSISISSSAFIFYGCFQGVLWSWFVLLFSLCLMAFNFEILPSVLETLIQVEVNNNLEEFPGSEEECDLETIHGDPEGTTICHYSRCG